jgi:intergrase/recombinase
MRDFIFFTNRKITAEECFEALKNEIQYVETNGADIWINAKSKSFLTPSDDCIDDFIFDSPEDFEEFKKKIPIQNPCITDFETHRSIDAKRVIKVLMQIYPELYVNVQDDDWWGTAQEYLDTEFDY